MKFHLLSILLFTIIVSCQQNKPKKEVEIQADTENIISKRPSITYINKQCHKLTREAAKRYNEEHQKGIECSFEKELFNMIDDSLSGLSNQCVKWNYIKGELRHNSYDSILIERCQSELTDSIIKLGFEKSLFQCRKNLQLLDQPLHPVFAQTLLKDTCGKELTFGELMDGFKDKVVFLDFWGLACGPCIASMPYAQDLKKELKGLSVEFVYFNRSTYNKHNTLRSFNLSQTKNNHYFLNRGLSNNIYKYMGVTWVPYYLIFDKNGYLVDMDQTRPSEYGNRILKEKLTKLALEVK